MVRTKYPKADIIEDILSKKSHFRANDLERDFFLNFEIKADHIKPDKRRRRIIGFAATSHKDRVRDILTPQALRDVRNVLLQDGSRTVFLNHDRDQPIGKVVSSQFIKGKGLLVEIEISKASDVDDVWIKIQEGVLNSLSIGGRFKRVRIERDERGDIVAFKVLEMELFEVSVVGLPANPKAKITDVIGKSLEGWTKMVKNIKSKTSASGNIRRDKVAKKKKNNASKKAKKKDDDDDEEDDDVALVKSDVSELIEDALKPVTKAMKSITEAVGGIATQVKGIQEDLENDEEVDDEDDEDEDDEDDDDEDDDDDKGKKDKKKTKTKTKTKTKKTKKSEGMETSESLTAAISEALEAAIKPLRKQMADATKLNKKRKGVQDDDEDDDGDDNEDTPKKTLEGIDDEDTMKYLKYVMVDDPSAYDDLNDTDKNTAKEFWFQAMLAVQK